MVSTGLSAVSIILGVSKLVVFVITLGLEVTTVVSMSVLWAGTDVVVSAMSVVEAIFGAVLTAFDGSVVDRV